MVAIILVFVACGSEDDEEQQESFESIEIEELQAPDVAEVDIDWAPETLVAEESDVMTDIENINTVDGNYRVAQGSPLLDGVVEGSIVMWPQVGIFEVISLDDDGDFVHVQTEWARLADAVTSADIYFEHGLSAGDPGRAVGMVVDSEQTQQELMNVRTGTSPLEFSSDGLTMNHKIGQYSIGGSLKMASDTMTMKLKVGSTTPPITLNADAKVKGIQSRGHITVAPGDEDETATISFDNIDVDVTADFSVKGADGSVEIKPPGQMVFPFVVGGIPLYVSLGTNFTMVSTLRSEEAVMKASNGFNLRGSIELGRDSDGSAFYDGELTRFETHGPGYEFNTAITAGVGVTVDTPRIAVGIGRPGVANAELFGTHTIEMVTNVALDPFANNDYCVTVNGNTGILAGGKMSFLSFDLGGVFKLYEDSKLEYEDGPLCD